MRILLILAFLVSFITINAQVEAEQNRPANPRVETNLYFPQAGDFGIGFDATPFIDYLGNMANGTMGNSLGLGDQNLYFRYFLTDKSALRLRIKIKSDIDVENRYVADDQARALDPLSQKELIDRKKSSVNASNFNVGYQIFRGESRLRGFFGAEIGAGYEKEKEHFEYGNKMSELNAAPSTAFGAASPRILDRVVKSNFTLSVGAFTGAEYYFLPKASIGVELGLAYEQAFARQTNVVREKMVIAEYVTENITIDAPSRESNLNTILPYSYGNLFLMIHF